MAVDAARWICVRCAVSVGRIDGELIAMPPSWTRAGAEIFCLSCSRALAGDVATHSAPASSSQDDLMRIRRQALVEFELERDPDAPNRTIARACHTSTLAVAAIRKKLDAPTAVLPGADRRNGR